MADFNAAAVRWGEPGKLMVAPLGTPEPTTHTQAWPAGWVGLGYTDEGSAFNYEISTENVEVAEELDVFARVTTGRDVSIEVALAEITYKNLNIAFNGGLIDASEQDGAAWFFEPPTLGDEQRIMLGWDSYLGTDPSKNDLRFIFRQVVQGGTVTIENRKGATKQTIGVTFQLEKPITNKKIMRIMGTGTLNPNPSAVGVVATTATAGSPGTFNGDAPASLVALQSGSVTASPTTPWTTGQSVELGTGQAYWDGDSWMPGTAP